MAWDLLSADAITNVETDTYEMIGDIASAKWERGAPGVELRIDARGNSAKLRRTVAGSEWDGPVVWYINAGQSLPIHLISGDSVRQVETVEVPWTPQFMPNKIGWWDAQSLGLSDGLAISQFTDRSGKGNHFVQTDTARPVMDIDKINGHPAVVADGVNDFMSVTLAATFTSPFVVYAVAGTDLVDATSGFDWLFDGMNLSGAGTRAGIYRTTGELYGMARSAAITGGSWTTGPKLLRASFDDAGTSTLHSNNVQVASGALAAAGTSGTLQKLFMFCGASAAPSGLFFPGYLGEMIVVQGPVTSDNNTKALQYLNSRWSLGLTI